MVSGIRSIVGADFVGAYLQGSFAVGGFDAHSDVDFAVVIERGLSDEQVRLLQAWHGRIYESDCEWSKHLEGSYFPRELLARPEGRGRLLWYLDNGAKSLVLSEHCNTVVVRWVLREHGVALVGPPARGLIDPIPVEVLRAEIERTMREWGAEILASPERYRNRFYQSFIVLSYAKMLHDLRTGRIGSKRDGAEWAKGVLNQSWADVIDRAWDGRPNPAKSVREPADPVEFRRTLRFVEHVIGQIAHPD
jgi:hypothetical protein